MSAYFTQSPSLLPYVGPASQMQRLLLFMVRRMAAHGLTDAHATNAMLAKFGRNYRRPLILLRVFMAEMAFVSRRQIRIAPCCCLRMTEDEALITNIVSQSLDDMAAAHQSLTGCLGTADCLSALSSAQAVAQSFADLGSPFEDQDFTCPY